MHVAVLLDVSMLYFLFSFDKRTLLHGNINNLHTATAMNVSS